PSLERRSRRAERRIRPPRAVAVSRRRGPSLPKPVRPPRAERPRGRQCEPFAAGAGDRDLVRRDGRWPGARPGTAGRLGGLQRGGARPVRRGGARGGQPGAPGGHGRDRGPCARHRRRQARGGRRERGGRRPRPGRGAARRGGRRREAMVATGDRALATAGVKLAEVDGIAVTAGPGLAGALLVGVCAAKAYALALDKPLYAVNHLAAHIAVDQLEHGPLPRPAVALLVSGGHSSLLLVPDVAGEVLPLGATIDDAAGEAYDKVARLLGMPFPGGPPVDAAARGGDGSAIAFPRGKYRDDTFDFSFSGLKTA